MASRICKCFFIVISYTISSRIFLCYYEFIGVIILYYCYILFNGADIKDNRYYGKHLEAKPSEISQSIGTNTKKESSRKNKIMKK